MDKTAQEMDVRQTWARYNESRDPALRQELITRNMHLVRYVVERLGFGVSHLDREDLISEGIVGLIDAVDRFDPERGIQFVTYATIRIRGQILDALRTRDMLPRSARRRVKGMQDAVQTLVATLGEPPSEEQLAEFMNVSPEQLQQTLCDASLEICSLDAPLVEDGEAFSLQNLLEASEDGEPAEQHERSELREELRGALRRLPERQQLLLSLYYVEELTMREIGEVLSVSESRVSQLHAQAIMSLRALLETAGYIETRSAEAAPAPMAMMAASSA